MNMGIEVFLFLECADLAVTINKHGKRWCLHSTNYQLLVVKSGKQPCAVYADNPVSLGTAQSRFIKTVIFFAVFQVIEALSDSSVLKRADPQTLERLCASGFVVDKPKNQLALASGIRRTDKLGDALVCHKITQDSELLRLVLWDLKTPLLRDNGQIVISPLGIAFIVGDCIRKPHQMTDAP